MSMARIGRNDNDAVWHHFLGLEYKESELEGRKKPEGSNEIIINSLEMKNLGRWI